jgi:hypothetical protein
LDESGRRSLNIFTAKESLKNCRAKPTLALLLEQSLTVGAVMTAVAMLTGAVILAAMLLRTAPVALLVRWRQLMPRSLDLLNKFKVS